MNVERMLLLADVIEDGRLGLQFEMDDWCRSWTIRVGMPGEVLCGTAACIAGHAACLFGRTGAPIFEEAYSNAAGLLGLTHAQRYRLFSNAGDYISPKCLEYITREEAVAAIRRMVAEEQALHHTNGPEVEPELVEV